MDFYEERLEEDKEYEEFICEAPAYVEKISYSKYPTKLQQNPLWQKWRATSRASVADFLFGFSIRKEMKNKIAAKIYYEFYRKRNIIAARFTQQGLAERLGYKDRRGVNNHMVKLAEEGIFKIHYMPWRDREIRVYEFGVWRVENDCDYLETIHMYTKFNKLWAEEKIRRKS